MTNEYDFALMYKLADSSIEPYTYEDSLFEAGCDDALLGVGQKGFITLDFIRESDSAINAIESAIKNVRQAIPDAELFYISPDIVTASDIGRIMKCSRQNINKLISKHRDTFPLPINNSNSTEWHLSQVLEWYISEGYTIDDSLFAVSKLACNFNLKVQQRKLNPDEKLEKETNRLVTF